MKKLALPALGLALMATPANAATYVFVGDWYVGEGPVWTDNPEVLNALETAALLFGGNASDYAISTIDDDPNNINFRSHVDGWGDTQFLTDTVAQDFKLDEGAPGYGDPGGFGSAYSAYVLDHSCSNRYSNPSQGCLTNQIGRNFAFRIMGGGAVPEPATWAMMLLGFFGLGAAMRRKPAVKTTVSYA